MRLFPPFRRTAVDASTAAEATREQAHLQARFFQMEVAVERIRLATVKKLDAQRTTNSQQEGHGT